jgi:hypothetical protein
MQLSAADIKKYPKFARYVSLNMPEVAQVSVIINKIQELAGTIEKSTIKEALKWGKGPMINVADLADDTNGEFTPDTHSNEIRINKKRVQQFEAGKGLEATATGRLVYIVGTILLHELTHWADDQDGVDTPGEEGKAFEMAIYGKDMGNGPM